MPAPYMLIIDRVLVRGGAIIRESYRYCKVYRLTDCNEIGEAMHREKRRVDFMVFLPELLTTSAVLAANERLIKESDRYKLYLPKRYSDMLEKLYRECERVDLLVVLK